MLRGALSLHTPQGSREPISIWIKTTGRPGSGL